mgnify:CR=1 FL=1
MNKKLTEELLPITIASYLPSRSIPANTSLTVEVAMHIVLHSSNIHGMLASLLAIYVSYNQTLF